MPSLRTVRHAAAPGGLVQELAARQEDQESVVKGPPAPSPTTKAGKPTKAALGFARGQGVGRDVAAEAALVDGKEYAVAVSWTRDVS